MEEQGDVAVGKSASMQSAPPDLGKAIVSERQVSGSEDRSSPKIRALDSPRQGQGSCCGLFRGNRKKKVDLFTQTLVVCRHSERLDQKNPAEYAKTEDSKAWPHDTPLTQDGIRLASTVAEEIESIHETSPFTCVVSSPYRRCLQTAAEIARRLRLRVLVDQEMGEVWDKTMDKSKPPHRPPIEVRKLVDDLGLNVVNPATSDGGVKFFGRQLPADSWPETIETAHKRYLTRMACYIEQGLLTEQNFILVTHCPCIVAALDIFARGNAEITSVKYCGRVIATRTVERSRIPDLVKDPSGVYAEKWDIDARDMEYTLNAVDGSMHKYYENMHLEACQEQEKKTIKRKQARTKTDQLHEDTVRELAKICVPADDVA